MRMTWLATKEGGGWARAATRVPQTRLLLHDNNASDHAGRGTKDRCIPVFLRDTIFERASWVEARTPLASPWGMLNCSTYQDVFL